MIEMIAGRPGAGKSYYAGYRAHQAKKRGIPVFANYSLKGARTFKMTTEQFWWWEVNPELPEGGEWIESALYFPEKGLIIIDEAQEFFSSHEWQSFGKIAVSFFSQSRKDGIRILILGQSTSLINKTIRDRVEQTHFPKQWLSAYTGFTGKKPHPLLFTVKSYWECKDKYKPKQDPNHIINKWIFFRWEVANSYDTNERFGEKQDRARLDALYNEMKAREEARAKKALHG